MTRDLTELNKLESYLKAHGYEYRREDHNKIGETCNGEPVDFHQIKVYKYGMEIWDVVCQCGSYGAEKGLLEGMGDIFGFDVEGYLTADDVIQRIERTRK